MNHLFITPNDIAILTGKSVKTSRRYLSLIKDALGKEDHQGITIFEYASYEGVDYQEVIKFLGTKGEI
ncbi:MAG: hypothetical protein HXX16_17255 [Bacteroidales bacterium]|nr:hypothetical protein [Bacteroidales bacterium]